MDITEDNRYLAIEATKDILFMYVDLAESRGFEHGIDRGKFASLEFVAAPIFDPAGYTLGIDIALLQNGSAIALLCELSDAWDECQTWNSDDRPLISNIKKAYVAGCFTHLDEIQNAFELGFGKNEEEFREQLEIVYKKYVLSYFDELLKDGIS